MSKQWQIGGTYFEACTCRGACPCLFNAAPTEGTCDALVGWHIERGHYGDTALDGLSVALAAHVPGHMADGDWKVVLYLDDQADSAQRDALVDIFGGRAGGHPAVLASFVGEILGVEPVPMAYEATGRRRSLRVGDAAAASLEAIEGQGGEPPRILAHPFAVAPGNELTVAQSERVTHRGHGLDWEFSERAAYYSPFTYASA